MSRKSWQQPIHCFPMSGYSKGLNWQRRLLLQLTTQLPCYKKKYMMELLGHWKYSMKRQRNWQLWNIWPPWSKRKLRVCPFDKCGEWLASVFRRMCYNVHSSTLARQLYPKLLSTTRRIQKVARVYCLISMQIRGGKGQTIGDNKTALTIFQRKSPNAELFRGYPVMMMILFSPNTANISSSCHK